MMIQNNNNSLQKMKQTVSSLQKDLEMLAGITTKKSDHKFEPLEHPSGSRVKYNRKQVCPKRRGPQIALGGPSNQCKCLSMQF